MHYRTRATTIQILEMAESGALDPVLALRAALNYMSENEVEDLAHSEGWIEADEDEDEADAEEDEAEEDEADAEEADAEEADAEDDAWHAYRWPTRAETDSGRPEWAVVWLGSAPTEEGAVALLPRRDGIPSGQVQHGKRGRVHNM